MRATKVAGYAEVSRSHLNTLNGISITFVDLIFKKYIGKNAAVTLDGVTITMNKQCFSVTLRDY